MRIRGVDAWLSRIASLRGESNPPQDAPRRPFVLELREEGARPSGAFAPSAAVLITPDLKRSRLLAGLDLEEIAALFLVLSCVTPNGTFVATPESLASAVDIPRVQLLFRLRRLAKRRWNGRPILVESLTGSGMRLYAPAPGLFEVRHVGGAGHETASADNSPEDTSKVQADRAARRAAAIELSRRKYARPRAEVEAEISRFLSGEGYSETPARGPEVPTPDRRLIRRLMAWGVKSAQAERLVSLHPKERIESQLEYLPYRQARNAAAFLVAAVGGDYGPPKGWKARRAEALR